MAASKTAANRTMARVFAEKLLEDADYQQNLLLRLRNGLLPAQLETTLWHYRFGKPVEEVHLNREEDLSDLTTDDLRAMLKDLERVIEQVEQSAQPLT